MLHYKKEIPAMTDLVALYSSVGWTNYTNNPTMLEEAVKASLWQLAVYDEKELVAYIRLVGDGHSVIFVQKKDILCPHKKCLSTSQSRPIHYRNNSPMSYFFCYENYLNIFVVVLQHDF